MTIRVHVRIIPRSGLLDPQGQAIEHALSALGFSGVGNVRVGKAIELSVDAASPAAAEAATRDMCQRLLANPVTEDFLIQAEPA
jgi:phosphoribosylformylglycinamidine synthase